MRIKGILAKGLLISIAVALIPVAAVSAPKVTPGSTCKVVNQKVVYLNKTYTCVKSGKKLLWNKGVVLKAVAKPTPSQTSMPTPITRREKALAEVKRVYELNTTYQPTVKYIFASDAPQNFAELIKEVIPFSSRFWSSEFKPTTEFPIILGSLASVEWVNDEMKRYGHEIPAWNREFIKKLGENASRGDVVNNSRGAITYYVIGKEKDRSIKAGNELTMRGFVAHEYVHAVAVSIIGDREKGIPGWSVEGSANFYGFAIAALMGDQPIVAMNKANVGNLRRSYSEQGALVPHSLNKDDLYKAVITSEKGGGGDGTTCAEPKLLCYSAGALFTEVLVADHGHAKFVDWWKLSRKKNWEVAFEEVFGIQIDKWYEEVAIPYVIQESKAAVPEVSAPKSASTFTQHPTRPPRPFIDPGSQNQKPTLTPTTAPKIVPKIFDELYGNSQGIAFAAWSSASAKIEKSNAVAVRQDIFVGPNTTIPNANAKEIFENATRLFAGFAQPQSFYAVYYRFQDKDWAKAKFGELNLSRLAGEIDGSCASLQRCNGASAGKASDTVGFSQYGVTEPGGQTSAYHLGGGLEIHEYTHIAQAMQFIGKQKDDQNFNYLPRWFIEGHAHIAGNTGSAKTFEEYLKNRGQWLSTSPNQEIKSFEPVDVERFYAALMPGKYNAEMFGYVYTIGYITIECLVALKGIDSPTELIVQVSNGLTFEEAFAKVYGISWNEASPILAKTVSQIFLARG
jgi:hypothetical protein